MAATLDVPPNSPEPDWKALRDWLYKLWYILRGISGDGSGNVTFPGNVTVDGNLTVVGTTTVAALSASNITATSVTTSAETVNGNSHITGNLQVDGNINGTSSYTILLGVYSGMLGE